jgi:DNA-binding IclR family transcriptional regulator
MPEVGIVIPAHASALGKAILAFDDDATARLLSISPLRSMTGETLTAPIALKEQLADVGTTGLAYEKDEAVLGECAIAGPVFDATGTPAGAIGLVIPTAGWPAEQSTRDAVRAAARAISRELGAPAWPPSRP